MPSGRSALQIDRQADTPTEVMAAPANGVCGDAERYSMPSPQINQAEDLTNCDRYMDVGLQVRGA